jgi:ABC-2 type transport system permease protein
VIMKLMHDTGLIFSRSLQITLRNPVWIVFGLFQPLCFLLLFAPLLGKLVGIPGFGAGNALTIFTPGLLIMIALYSTAFVGFGLIDDIRAGVIERFRVTPIDRVALLLGRSLRDIFILTFQTTFLIIIAWLLGLEAPWFGIALSYGLVWLVGFTMSITSYTVALILQSEDALAPLLNFFLLPLQLLAGITLPLALAPVWLQNLALFNPLAHAVSATRALFIGAYTDSSVFWGYGTMIVVAVVAYWISSNLFKKVTE